MLILLLKISNTLKLVILFMLQQHISRKIGAFVDWSANYIDQKYPGLKQDHHTITLFKNILMSIDSIYFKQLISQPSSINELESIINQYYFEKYSQTKEASFLEGNAENTTIRILAIFQLVLELAYVSSKEKCLAAISQLDTQVKKIIEKILEQIIIKRANKQQLSKIEIASSSQQSLTSKQLQEENQKLKDMVKVLRANENNLIHLNSELQNKISLTQYQNQRKDLEIEERNRKISDLQSILKQVSAELFSESHENPQKVESKQQSKFDKYMNSPAMSDSKISSNSFKQEIEEITKTSVENSLEKNQQANNNEIIQRLQNQCRKSEQVNYRFEILKEIHQKFRREVEDILMK